ncbi:hypothetical protein BH11BAC4_BH11BAC4_08970 [soil metagenome]
MAKKASKPATKKKAALIKKTAPKKSVAKKSTPKKNTPQKAVANKPPIKKAAAKKAVAKKSPVKKAVPVNKVTTAKPGVKKAVIKKKPVIAVKKSKPVTPPNALPSPNELSEKMVEKTVHTEQVVNQTGDVNNGLNLDTRADDPLRSFDKHEFQKASAKRDPKSKLHLSSTAKGSVKPSGKKPLW